MATTTAAHFVPTTDSFGQLTLTAQRGLRALPMNLIITVVFISVFVLAMFGVIAADQAAFEHAHGATAYYEGVELGTGLPLDYD